MNKTIICGRLFILFAIITGVFFSDSTVAQNKAAKTTKKQKSSKRAVNRGKTAVVLSKGVINAHVAKPEDLVKPFYPPAAKALGASGSVSVEVLIDEQGNVIEAKSIYGHPLLRPASITAARKSKFTITLLSRNPVKVRGYIIYNFIPVSFNWLEIGYILQSEGNGSVYNLKNLTDLLPHEFETERQMLEMVTEENKNSIFLSVRSMMESKLSDKPKDKWLLSLGYLLSKANLNFRNENETRRQILEELRPLIQTAPENVKPNLIERLEKLAALLENPALDEYDSLKGSKSRQKFNEI